MAKYSIGAQIKKHREFKGLKSEYVASLLDLTDDEYNDLESGESDITYSKLIYVAFIFKMGVGDLIASKVPVTKITSGSFFRRLGLSDDERKLYEQTISQQKEQIDSLEKEVNHLKSKLNT